MKATEVVRWCVSAALALGCSGVVFVLAANKAAAAVPDYILGISESQEDFEDDGVISAKGAGIDGFAVIQINGEPVTIYDWGGRVIKLNPHLLKGENRIEVTGKYTGRLYLKVGLMQGQSVRVLSKQEFSSNQSNALVFTSDLQPDAPQRASLAGGESAQHEMVKDLQNELAEIERGLRAHQGDQLVRQFSELSSQWYAAALGKSPKDFELAASKMIEFINDPSMTVSVPKGELQYIFGKSLVLVWRCNEGKPVPLFQMRTKEQDKDLSRFRFARVGEEWKVWE